jgi:hypothetical protein
MLGCSPTGAASGTTTASPSFFPLLLYRPAARSLISRRHPHLTRRQPHHPMAPCLIINPTVERFDFATLVVHRTFFLIAIVLFFFFSFSANAR